MPEIGDERFYRKQIALASTNEEREKFADALADLLVKERRIDAARAKRMARNDKPKPKGRPDARSHKHSLIDAWKNTGKTFKGTVGGGFGLEALTLLADQPELVEQWVPEAMKGLVLLAGQVGYLSWLVVLLGVLIFGMAYILNLIDKARQEF